MFNIKKSVSFNLKLNEILEYKTEKVDYTNDYLSTINKYLDYEKKDTDKNFDFIILKSGKKIKK